MRRQPILSCLALALSLMSVLSLTVERVAIAQTPPPAAAPPMPGQPIGMPPADAIQQPMPPSEVMPLPPPPLPPPPMVEAPMPPTAGPLPPPPPAPKANVSAKFSTDIYGFVEFDSIFDSTQSFQEIAGNTIIGKKGTFTGDHGRTTYSVRNSRLGFKFKGPESEDIHPSALFELDLLGNQPPTATEAQLLTNPTVRIRHAALKLETPYIDVLAGQTWQLFGWQGSFFPCAVQIMGLPAQVFGRAPQLRLSHPFKTDDVTVEVAVASARSPQRDGAIPDTQAGIRLLVNNWKGAHTANSTGTAVDSLGIGVSGVYRKFRVNELSASPKATNSKDAGGISVDALIPVVPATAESRANALTLTGSYVRGTGIADLFTGLTGGVTNPALPNPMMLATAPAYTPNIDPGLVTHNPLTGDPTNPGGDAHTIDWQAFMVGIQYYLPPSGSVWLSGNYTQLNSPNMHLYAETPTHSAAAAAGAMKKSQFADGNIFVEVNKAVRFGGELAWYKQRFVDESTSTDWRGQVSAFYLF